jgi:hypothetical protein
LVLYDREGDIGAVTVATAVVAAAVAAAATAAGASAGGCGAVASARVMECRYSCDGVVDGVQDCVEQGLLPVVRCRNITL